MLLRAWPYAVAGIVFLGAAIYSPRSGDGAGPPAPPSSPHDDGRSPRAHRHRWHQPHELPDESLDRDAAP